MEAYGLLADAAGTTPSGEESRGEEAEAWAVPPSPTLLFTQISATPIGARGGIPLKVSFEGRAVVLNHVC